MKNTTNGASGTSQQDDKSKKRKTYEERNSHHILPEGSRRIRKSRHIEDAEDENTGPKKQSANKKGKGKKK